MGFEHNALSYGIALSRAAARAAGMNDGELGLARLGETLTPTMDLWSRPEWALLRGERLWMVNPSIGATVAEFSQVGIRNPVGSGLITVVQGWLLNSAVTGNFQVRAAASTLVDATSTPNARDSRVPLLTGIQTVSLATSAAAALGSLYMTIRELSSSSTARELNFVLSPGFDVYIGPDAVNLLINATIWGYERQAFPGELQARG